MLNLLIIRQTFILEVLLLLNIPIQGSSQVFPIQVVYGISFEHPFLLGNIVLSDFSCVLEYPLENSSMQGNISVGIEGKGLAGENLCDVGRNLICLFLVFILRCTDRLALIVRVNQFSGFIQSDFSFDVSLSHIYEIRRWLQPIYSLQSDSRLPVLGTFLLRRFSLSKIFIEGCELVDIIFIHRCNA